MFMSNYEIKATGKVEITWGFCSDVLMKVIIWSERLSECRSPRRSPPTFKGQGKSSGRNNDVNAVNDCGAWRVWVCVVWSERKSLSVPGGRLGLFLFLLFSVPFSRGQSEPRGPLELLNCRGSLFVAGSKDSGFRPVQGKKTDKLGKSACSVTIVSRVYIETYSGQERQKSLPERSVIWPTTFSVGRYESTT